MKLKRYEIIILILILLAAFGMLGTMDAEEAELEAKAYCAMVAEYKATNGKSGWPAYQGTAMCR